jgi:hypothetical protein
VDKAMSHDSDISLLCCDNITDMLTRLQDDMQAKQKRLVMRQAGLVREGAGPYRPPQATMLECLQWNVPTHSQDR